MFDNFFEKMRVYYLLFNALYIYIKCLTTPSKAQKAKQGKIL